MRGRKVWKRKLDIKTGAEGPSHDPWGYTEAIVEINEHKVVLHQGLAVWVRIDAKTYYLSENACYRVFRRLTGFENIDDVSRAIAQTKKRRGNWCCRYHAEWIEGMPGESFLRCKKCGTYLDSAFDIMAVY